MFPASEEDQTSKNIIYVELRRLIIMRHLKPGERLDVEALATQYKTSVTPVRDALRMLSQDGLVNIKPRSGYFVKRTTLKQLRDLLDLRHILEVAAVERAAIRISQDQVVEMRSVHAGYTGDDDESYDRYTDENRKFHYYLAKATGNYELTQLMGRLHDLLAPFMVMRHGGRNQESTHKRIVDALEIHDVEKAREALLDDIERSHDSILDKVLQEEAESWHVG
ncbi:MAG: GntR family transcriptional regulator [Chloroflexota bacterium]|jgi:DNA-binding GntR family transcriptional regulator